MNHLHIIGNVGADAEIRTTQNGRTYIQFNVAVTEKYGQTETTTWFTCTKWVNDGGSTKIADYIKKGHKIGVFGKVSARAYTNQSGEAKCSLDVNVLDITLIGQIQASGQANQSNHAAPAAPQHRPAQQQQPQQQTHNDGEDDLPF